MPEPKLTDEALRQCLLAEIPQAEIARRHGISDAAVSKRVKKLGLTTAAAATLHPKESRRYVNSRLDALEQLTRSIGKVNLLMDACDEWLRDVNDPEKYDVGPRSEEVMVTWTDGSGEKPVKRKTCLADLLERVEGKFPVERAETKHADPRELILKTAQEVRQTVGQAADIARMLADARAMQALREAVIEEVRRVDPDSGARIADAVRRSVLLQRSLGGLGPVAPGVAEDN